MADNLYAMSDRRDSARFHPSVPATGLPAPRRNSRRATWLFIAGTLLGLVILTSLLAVYWPRSGPHNPRDSADDFVEDPRVTHATPFRNVRPQVQYVGDEACAGCHREECRAFHRHPMGLSVTPIGVLGSTPSYDAAVGNPFSALGSQFHVARHGDRVHHAEKRLDGDGAVLAESSADMDYALGSGAQVISYLFWRGDYLFQSPISWFADRKHWGLSPDFDKYTDIFERPVREECLFCHANYAASVKGTLNRYDKPLFPRGLSIGCERCHGPGELHVRERGALTPIDGKVDHSIVNPKHLTPALRDDVCNQCHVEGEPRILRRGRGVFDYRPGLPLYLFWTLFARLPELTEQGKFVGQVEQLRDSRCYQGTKGRLGCTACHDAHEQPSAAAKSAIYRQHCVDCHETKVCTAPPAERRQRNDDNCVACHMQRHISTDINHTAITDHRILRVPENTPAHPVPRKLHPGQVPLVNFHKDQDGGGDPEVSRDTGLALVEMAQQGGPLARQLGETAQPLLEAALARGPRDAPAHEALAFVLAQQGNHKEALALVEKVLARSPKREPALTAAASHAEKAGELQRAVEYWQRAIEVNPWFTSYRLGHARALNLHGKHDRVIDECEAALKLNPGSTRIRSLLVSSLLESKRRDRAQAEFDALMKLNSATKEELRQWFEQQIR